MRISNHSQQQVLLNRLLDSKQTINTYQNQVSTGLKSQNLQGLARESNALLASKSTMSRLETYMQSNRELQTRLEIQNTALGSIANVADDLRQDMISAVNLNSSVGFITKIEDNLDRLINLVNTSHNGQYIFAGTRTDQEPINVDNATDVLALASISDAFDNNSIKPSQLVDDNRSLEFGLLAEDVAAPLLNAISRVLEFNSGTLPSGAAAFAPAGAFQDPLTTNQRDFLVAEFANANAAITTARDAEAINGVDMAAVDKLVRRQEEDFRFLSGFVSDLQNVDIAEAISNLQNSETALTASIQVLARLNQISLLNFL